MTKKALLALALGTLLTGVGCRHTRGGAESDIERAGEKTEDAAEKAGDKVEDAAENAADKTENAAENAGDKIEDATDK